MLINYSFQTKFGGFSQKQSSVRRQVVTVFNHLKTGIQKSLSDGLLRSAVAIYKQSPLLVGAVAGFSIISFIFVVLIFALTGGNGSNSDQNNIFLQADGQFTPAEIKYHLNVIALGFIEDDNWNKQSIVDFAYGWNALDSLEKSEIRQTVWFQLLENTLMNKLSADANGSRGRLLADLSAQLGIPLSEGSPATAQQAEPAKKNQLATVKGDAVKAEAPQAQAPKIQATQTQAAQTKAAQTKVDQTKKAQTKEAQTETRLAATPQRQEADATVLSQKLNSNTSRANIVPQQPALQTAKIPQNQPQVASATAGLDKPARVNKVIRTPLPAEAQSVAAVGGAKVALPAKQSAKQATSSAASNRTISETELEEITSEFVTSYEAGNIVKFASLFAEKAVSNDEADLNTIKKDYANLFATTSDRRMIIGNLKWDLSKRTAKGEGKLEVAVKSAGAEKAQSYSGKIHIVVEKQENGVQITELYHALQ
ncbi:MAG: hypothetical protein PVF82_07040 [Gammaproteobacteria bacterium]|jgi:hypothetical protein